MSHDENLVFQGNEFPERLCLHSGFDPGILRSLLTFSAIVCNTMAVFDDCLVSAPCQGKVDGDPGVVITLGISVVAKTKTDT